MSVKGGFETCEGAGEEGDSGAETEEAIGEVEIWVEVAVDGE